MRRQQRELKLWRDLDVEFHKPPAHAEAPAIQQEAVVRVRSARDDGKSAQDGDVDVCVAAGDVFPVRVVEAGGLQAGAKLQQRVGAANFLKRQHIRAHGQQCVTHLGLALGGFRGAPRHRAVEVVLDVVGRHTEALRSSIPGRQQPGCGKQEQETGTHGLQV